jgi:hypothetical protein
MPAGYVPHSGSGFTLGLGPGWNVANQPGKGLLLLATNTVDGRHWMLASEKAVDAKPASQTFDDFVATQRAKCSPGTVPDTLTVAAGPVYVCRIDMSGLVVLDYRLPVRGDVWHLSLGFEDGKYSGTGQTEAETILRTLVLTP